MGRRNASWRRNRGCRGRIVRGAGVERDHARGRGFARIDGPRAGQCRRHGRADRGARGDDGAGGRRAGNGTGFSRRPGCRDRAVPLPRHWAIRRGRGWTGCRRTSLCRQQRCVRRRLQHRGCRHDSRFGHRQRAARRDHVPGLSHRRRRLWLEAVRSRVQTGDGLRWPRGQMGGLRDRELLPLGRWRCRGAGHRTRAGFIRSRRRAAGLGGRDRRARRVRETRGG